MVEHGTDTSGTSDTNDTDTSATSDTSDTSDAAAMRYAVSLFRPLQLGGKLDRTLPVTHSTVVYKSHLHYSLTAYR